MLKPWLKECWCIPPERNAEFVAAMEDALAVYLRPPDPARPLVCLDEASKQLVKATRRPQPAQPGQPARYDAAYERAGVRNRFLAVAPLEGWRAVQVTEHRTAPTGRRSCGRWPTRATRPPSGSWSCRTT